MFRAKGLKIKIIYATCMESEINEWLEKNDVYIVDIKYERKTQNTDKCLIFYREIPENEKDKENINEA